MGTGVSWGVIAVRWGQKIQEEVEEIQDDKIFKVQDFYFSPFGSIFFVLMMTLEQQQFSGSFFP